MGVLDLNMGIEFGEREKVWEVTKFGLLGVFQILASQELIKGKCELVIQFNIKFMIMLMGVCTLAKLARAHEEEVWGFNLVKEGHGLARVNEHEDLLIHSLHMHLLVNLCKIF